MAPNNINTFEVSKPSGSGGKVVLVDEPRRMASNDSLSVRSMDSSRDEMTESRSYGIPKPSIEPPHRLEGISEGMRGASATQFRNKKGLNGYATVVETPSGEDEILEPKDDWLQQFAVIVQKRRCASAPGGAEIDTVRVRSPLLKAVLSEHLSAYSDYANAKLSFPMDFVAPFAPLFHCWDAVVKLSEEHPDPTTREHLQILHETLAKNFEKPLKKVEDCRLTGKITFHSFWTIFKPGQLLYRRDIHGKWERLMRIVSAFYGRDRDNVDCFMINAEFVCWDGRHFGIAVAAFDILDAGPGKITNISELPVMPLDMHPEREAIKTRMLKKGQRYSKLIQTELKVYTGPEGEASLSHQTDGPLQIFDRIMINPAGLGCVTMARNLDPLIKENPFDKAQRDSVLETNSSSPGSLRRQRERSYVTNLRKAREDWEKAIYVKWSSGKFLTLTEEQMLYTASFIPAFDLLRKTWVSVDMTEIGDVQWNEDAYLELPFPEDEKDLLLSMVRSHADSPVDFESILDKKGKGTLVCLNGPSGMGKTAIVEALTERAHIPLYSISTVEIIRDWNENYKTVEGGFLDALERCRKWNAIMLIKDIDYLLDKSLEPTATDDHLAMIVDHLTTHPGLVFFTTEKLSAIDPFLQSRFDLTIQVPALNAPSRRQVWENAISQALPLRQRHFTSEHLDHLAQKELSGREIKSAVKMALMAAKAKDESLKMAHIEKVLAIKERSKLQTEAQPKVDE